MGGWPAQARFWLESGCSQVTDLVRRTKLDCPHAMGTNAFSRIMIPRLPLRLRSGLRQSRDFGSGLRRPLGASTFCCYHRPIRLLRCGGWPCLLQSFETQRVPRPSFAWAGSLTSADCRDRPHSCNLSPAIFHHKSTVPPSQTSTAPSATMTIGSENPDVCPSPGTALSRQKAIPALFENRSSEQSRRNLSDWRAGTRPKTPKNCRRRR